MRRPRTAKTTIVQEREDESLRFALSSMQGRRQTMEDKHSVSLSLPGEFNDWAFAGVFDGHGGKKVAEYASNNLLNKVLKKMKRLAVNADDEKDDDDEDEDREENMRKLMQSSFLSIDREMKNTNKTLIDDGSGSTAVCVLISPTHYYFANCGDSRAFLYRNNQVHFTTVDHKPTDAEEKERIEAAGGAVRAARVNGGLALSRALGDYEYKDNKKKSSNSQMVIPKPDVSVIERDDELDEFIVLACDGVFDVMSNDELATYIRVKINSTDDFGVICENVLDRCLAKGSADNMSIVIIPLPGCPSKKQETKCTCKRKLAADNDSESTTGAKKARTSSQQQISEGGGDLELTVIPRFKISSNDELTVALGLRSKSSSKAPQKVAKNQQKRPNVKAPKRPTARKSTKNSSPKLCTCRRRTRK